MAQRLKNYIYISRQKLATYWPQVIRDHVFKAEGQKVKAQLEFTLGLIKGSVGAEQVPIESCVTLCEFIEDYIAKTDPPGELDSGKRWIRGELGVHYVELDEGNDYLGFVSKVHDTALLFVGSRAYMDLTQAAQPVQPGLSHTPAVKKMLKEWMETFREKEEGALRILYDDGPKSRNERSGVGDFELTVNIAQIYRQAPKDVHRVSLLARRLFFATSEASKSVATKFAVYTPLYVIEE